MMHNLEGIDVKHVRRWKTIILLALIMVPMMRIMTTEGKEDSQGDMKVELPEFDGKMQGDAFLDWLYTVERIFEFKEFSEERNVKLVAIRLKGYASLWWENLKRERRKETYSNLEENEEGVKEEISF